MSTVLSDKVQDKIKDELADICCNECFIDNWQYDLLCNYINNEDGFFDHKQEWLWEGIDLSKAHNKDFPKIAARILAQKQILHDVKEEIDKCDQDIVAKHLEKWLTELKR